MTEQRKRNLSASDFGKFVYCPMKYFIDTIPAAQHDKQKKIESYNKSPAYYVRKAGQENEERCVEWVMKQRHPKGSRIVYNGTGDATETINALIPDQNTQIQCKPDLLVQVDDRLILYEFKAVGSIDYLKYRPAASNYAQVWCYTHIEGDPIHEFHLIKYYTDPFSANFLGTPFASTWEVKKENFPEEKLITLFQEYRSVMGWLSSEKARDSVKASDKCSSLRPGKNSYQCNSCVYKGEFCNPPETVFPTDKINVLHYL